MRASSVKSSIARDQVKCNTEMGDIKDDEYVQPVLISSALLGNVTYVSCLDHDPNLSMLLSEAVRKACDIFIPENRQAMPFELRVRLLRLQQGWLFSSTRPIVEWVFEMLKVRENFSAVAAHDGRESRPERTHGCASAETPHAETGGVTKEGEIERPNDPRQIREVLQFILDHSYKAIELNTFSDLKCGELVFDISVHKCS
ncbi:hypothetical protein ERJ75_001419200 [Trypanosoma vivax]|nr:hypothetical protein ERJ75_001419200 [Trypanosoma vivax]